MGILRLYLATCVVMAHVAKFPFPIGISPQNAVMIFFIISGFYISFILNKTYVGSGSLSAFYFNRFFRLWPIFIVIALSSLLAPIIFVNYGTSPNQVIASAFRQGNSLGALLAIFCSNFFMIFQDLQFYFSSNISHGFTLIKHISTETDLSIYDYVPQAWSIGVEINFYLLAPFIVRSVRTILIVMILSLLTNLYLIHMKAVFVPWHYAFLPAVLYLFMLGALSYHLFLGVALKRINWKDVLLGMIAISMLSIVSNQLSTDSFYITDTPIRFLFYALSISILFFITKNWRLDRFIGELSYPLYLCHLLILHVSNALTPSGNTGSGMLVVLLSFAASIILVIAIDMPINKWRHSFSKQMMQAKPLFESNSINEKIENKVIKSYPISL